MSRIPIREALLQLEAEGLVVIHTHKGAVVASLSVEDAVDLFEARSGPRVVAAQEGGRDGDGGGHDSVDACMTEYEQAVSSGATPEMLSRLNWAFHTAICEPARRPRMMAILLSLYTATDRYLRLQIETSRAKAKALEDHRALYDAFKARRVATAARLIKGHITGAYDDVMKQLRKAGHSDASQRRVARSKPVV